MFETDELYIVAPTFFNLLHLRFQAKTYDELKALARRTQANPLTYLSERYLMYRFSKFKNQTQALNQIKKLLNEEFDVALTDA